MAAADLDATAESVQNLRENQDQVLAALETGGITAGSATAVGGLAYEVLTRSWRREPRQERVAPLHQALAGPFGIAEQTGPRRYLHIPEYFTDDARIRVDLPTHLRSSREVVADVITQKLALEDVSFSWHPAGRKPHVMVKKTRWPPAEAVFKGPGMRERVTKAAESAPVIGVGIGSGGRVVSVDLDAEFPHIPVNASPGGGKSVPLRTITCPMLHRGSLPFHPRPQVDLPPVGQGPADGHPPQEHRRHPRRPDRPRHRS
ncbi:hypothetical protein [Streptomyces sp. NPDC020141]|uniref:hypothetical protein n=1 Tax=Streptomyces sp. NPDC020141 TaxID=3365065 RepID=UPI003796B799